MDAFLSASYQGASIYLKTFANLGGNSAFLCFNLQIANILPEKKLRYCSLSYGWIKFIIIITEILHFENHPAWFLCFTELHHHLVCVRYTEDTCNS